jgi:hypothetical protein
MSYKLVHLGSAIGLPFLAFAFCSISPIYSQTFSSGSTGSDGALNLTTPGVINFEPKSFNPPLDPSGDNVFNFTTIHIASGVVLELSGRRFTTPIYFLATGAVTIDGGINLNGENGKPGTNLASERVPAAPGAGGYPGGIGGTFNSPTPATAGSGPGGGRAGITGQSSGGNGVFVGSSYLIPLVGGSGGGGFGNDGSQCGQYGDGGGAGGGAIVIASSVSITFSRTVATDAILANGGTSGGCRGGLGSGGAIRIVAPVISGVTQLQTGQVGNSGLTRREAFQDTYSGGVSGALIQSLPFNVITPVTQGAPGLQVSSINGVPINANPFSFPDTTINTASPVTVNVTAQYIPVGTVPQILIYSELGPDQTVPCSALQGTLQQSTCTASIAFPTGGSRGFVKATW